MPASGPRRPHKACFYPPWTDTRQAPLSPVSASRAADRWWKPRVDLEVGKWRRITAFTDTREMAGPTHASRPTDADADATGPASAPPPHASRPTDADARAG